MLSHNQLDYMQPTITKRCLSLIAIIAALGLSVGCGSPGAADLLAQANSDNISRLSNVYQGFQSRHDWRGPRDKAELMAFLSSLKSTKLEAIGVDPGSIDSVFVSGRDGEPFKVRYGVPGHIMGSNAPVVFEATGVDGKRMVGFLNMTTREVDDAEYERLWNGQADEGSATR